MFDRLRGFKLAIAITLLFSSKLVSVSSAQPIEQEKVEAAITFQILSFTEWPAESVPSEKLVIGVLGSDGSYDAFHALALDARYREKYEVIKILPSSSVETLSTVNAIFFSRRDPVENPRLIRKLEGEPIVLIGAHENFLEIGGMINLVKRQRRLSFEINLTNAKAHDIAFRAKLLRLAAEVIK